MNATSTPGRSSWCGGGACAACVPSAGSSASTATAAISVRYADLAVVGKLMQNTSDEYRCLVTCENEIRIRIFSATRCDSRPRTALFMRPLSRRKKRLARERGFGAFVVWRGTAFFRRQAVAECHARLQREGFPESTTYLNIGLAEPEWLSRRGATLFEKIGRVRREVGVADGLGIVAVVEVRGCVTCGRTFF